MVRKQGMEPLERLLKRTRKERGLSIEDVIRDTRLRKIHLKQFETKLPEHLDVYQIGYLRLYARYLDLNIQEYIDAYQGNNNPSQQKSVDISKVFFKQPFAGFWKNVIALALVGALIAFGAFLIVKKSVHEHKKKFLHTESKPQEASAPVDGLIKKLNPHAYLLTGTAEQLSKVKIIANEATSFTILDSEKNIIAKGALKTGEQLLLPTDITTETITVPTSLPDVLGY